MFGTRIAQINSRRYRIGTCVFTMLIIAAVPAFSQTAPREQFVSAWKSAASGDRNVFNHLPAALEQYELFPYLVYEQLRHYRARTQPAEMADFLERHSDWAFASGLRRTWLKTLGKQKKWNEFLQYYTPSTNTELRCYFANALIIAGRNEEALNEASSLWLAGKSQPSECDPVLSWLHKTGGITPALAWQRVFLAMSGGNPRFTLYLARFLSPPDRIWLARWQDLNKGAYRKLGLATAWPDEDISREITSISLKRLALSDSQKAWTIFQKLDSHFKWSASVRGSIIREIALQAAVSLEQNAPEILAAIPAAHVDDQILQWWARTALIMQDWASLNRVIAQMAPETRADGRWRYWSAFAKEQQGQPEAASLIRESLSKEASYYGFLAADLLQKPYSICPLEPGVSQQAVDALRQKADFSRSLELRAAGMKDWALSEWSLAVARLDIEGLRTAAALAIEESWHDRAIFALGNSGDRQFYEWRFPLLWEPQVNAGASRNQLDASWVHGVMRSESALIETARSSAGAIGVMQITPATAHSVAREHGLAYKNSAQLTKADLNIQFGTQIMRDLLDRYRQNPVLVSAAYNAGPQAVNRWLDTRPLSATPVWIETIPYYETRDYIPRVLAFTAIYDWRSGQPVTRVSSRMPALDSSTTVPVETTTVV
ncbi:MAG: soluble lytic murein transglycosylase, partial [Rhodothermales bacterium]